MTSVTFLTKKAARAASNIGVTQITIDECGTSPFTQVYGAVAAEYPSIRKFTDMAGHHWVQKEVNIGGGSSVVEEILEFTGSSIHAADIAKTEYFNANPSKLKVGVRVVLKTTDGSDHIMSTFDGVGWTDSKPEHYTGKTEHCIFGMDDTGTWVENCGDIPVKYHFDGDSYSSVMDLRGQYFVDHPAEKLIGLRTVLKIHTHVGVDPSYDIISTWDGLHWVDNKPHLTTGDDPMTTKYGMNIFGQWEKI